MVEEYGYEYQYGGAVIHAHYTELGPVADIYIGGKVFDRTYGEQILWEATESAERVIDREYGQPLPEVLLFPGHTLKKAKNRRGDVLA